MKGKNNDERKGEREKKRQGYIERTKGHLASRVTASREQFDCMQEYVFDSGILVTNVQEITRWIAVSHQCRRKYHGQVLDRHSVGVRLLVYFDQMLEKQGNGVVVCFG